MGTSTAGLTSVLIPWRSADANRMRLWDYCRPRWQRLVLDSAEGIEVIVQSDCEPNGAPFMRARAFNLAAAQASGDVLVTWGADHLPEETALRAAVTRARSNGHGWAFVFSSNIAYTAAQTDALLRGAALTDIGVSSRQCGKGDVPGVLAITREAWDAVGGMDERFGAGYGYEDCALRNTLAHHFGHETGQGGTIRALYHPHTETPAQVNSALFWRHYAQLAPQLN